MATTDENKLSADGLLEKSQQKENFDIPVVSKEVDVSVKSSSGFPSCRQVLVAMGFFAFINLYCLRVNLSVAIVDMVDSDYTEQLDSQHKLMSLNATATSGFNESFVSGSENTEIVCEITAGNETVVKTEKRSSGRFQWDTKQQGLVLAAFFYGYTTSQIIGGTLAQRFGGKFIMLGGVFFTAVLTLITPVLAVYGDLPAIVAVRILEGVCEGVTFPSMAAMLSKWAPPLERSTMATAIYAGATMGTVIAMPISGLLCQYFGWESVFYVFGVLGLIWSVMWFFLIFNSPATHPRISTEERLYIETALGHTAANKASLSVPLRSIFTSVPFYALAVAHICFTYGYYSLMTCLPLYLKHILKFDIKSNGVVAGAPYIIMWFMITMSGFVADRLRSHNIMSTTNVRKMCIAIGCVLPGCCLIATGYVNCNTPLAVTLIIIGIGLSGAGFSGWSVNHLDLAPSYAGTLMGMTNTLATIPGFVGPSIIGAITYRNQTRAAWRTIFYITGAIYLFGTIVYAIFGSGEKQPWADSPKEPEERDEQELAERERLKDEKRV